MPERFKAWELGWEKICQGDGRGTWQQLREEAGLTMDEVEERTTYDGPVIVERQMMIENRGDYPDVQELAALAKLYGKAPGELLDFVLLDTGQPIFDEREREEPDRG